MRLVVDIGTSGVKAALAHEGGGRLLASARAAFATRTSGVEVEVAERGLMAAIHKAATDLPAELRRRVDSVAFGVMSPVLALMDVKGRLLTPLTTHQDRRSVAAAQRLASQIGIERYRAICGNVPVPGGMSVTTYLHLAGADRGLTRRVATYGHLSTYLLQRWAGVRAIDPGNASFTGLYQTTAARGGWSRVLLSHVGLAAERMPRVLDGREVAGTLTAVGARHLGLRTGVPIYPGLVDTSAAMLLLPPRVGHLTHSMGSTDVLAVLSDRPVVGEGHLTRLLGVNTRLRDAGPKWVHVSVMPASGSALVWAKRVLFSEIRDGEFLRRVSKCVAGLDRVRAGHDVQQAVKFDPRLAGSRTVVQQPSAAFTGLTLGTTRDEMLGAVVGSLVESVPERLAALSDAVGGQLRGPALVTGGGADGLAALVARRWPASLKRRIVDEAALSGLARLQTGLPAY